MKREVRRERKLPAFRIGIAELEALISRLSDLFQEPSKVRCTVTFRLRSEELNFNSVEEIRSCSSLPSSVSKFDVWLTESDRRIWIRSRTVLGDLGDINATAESEAWCAGAIEATVSFLRSYRPWFWWATGAPWGWISIALIFIPYSYVVFFNHNPHIPKSVSLMWTAILLASSSLFLARLLLLPHAALTLSSRESFLRRRAPEITIGIALLSLIATIAQFFSK